MNSIVGPMRIVLLVLTVLIVIVAGDQHPGEHLQLDERAEPRHRGDAGTGREPRRGDGDHPGGVDPARRLAAG